MQILSNIGWVFLITDSCFKLSSFIILIKKWVICRWLKWSLLCHFFVDIDENFSLCLWFSQLCFISWFFWFLLYLSICHLKNTSGQFLGFVISTITWIYFILIKFYILKFWIFVAKLHFTNIHFLFCSN